MAKQTPNQDRNFDDLADRFKRNIYGGLKGEIRLAVLNRDFREQLTLDSSPVKKTSNRLNILDAGGGQGQFSLQFAQAGHDVVICDISAAMLKLADEVVQQLGLQERVGLIQCAIQDLASHLPHNHEGFDVVICHAVIEWMSEPCYLLPCLLGYLKYQGYLSFTYYNLNSLIYKNLLRANFQKILNQDFSGGRGSLTPIHPMRPEIINEWLSNLPLNVIHRSGIRVFHDYILDKENRESEPEKIIALELEHSQIEPFLSLGRYIHILAKKYE